MRNATVMIMIVLGGLVSLAIGYRWPGPDRPASQTKTVDASTGSKESAEPVYGLATRIDTTDVSAERIASEPIPSERITAAKMQVPAMDSTTKAAVNVSGSLLLCGGGKLPDEIFDRFFELGGGDQGTLVVIPTASPRSDLVEVTEYLRNWTRFAWKQVRVLHAQSRDEAEMDEFSAALDSATAVWISGGDQNRLTSRYLGTPVESHLARLVRRGGVVGGTSAGTAVSSKVMIAGGYRFPIISEGFNLLPGVIVDQHFSQRRRFQRLQSALQRHPQCVGYGIDEGTGLLIGRERAEVIGRGKVFVYNAPKVPASGVVQVSYETNSTQAFAAGTVIPMDFSPLSAGVFQSQPAPAIVAPAE